jgi:flagellar biosynthesis/type III secretory pathway protein FliH
VKGAAAPAAAVSTPSPAAAAGISLPPAGAAVGMPAPAAGPTPTQPAPAAAAEAAAALQEAARLKAQAELADLRAEAERRGYAAGHDKGEADARRELQSQVERFEGLAVQLVQARAAVLADAEDGVVELAFAALCRILGEQAATREGVLAMVARCAAGAGEREQVGVRLHPDDFALLGEAAAHPARVSPDPGIVLGGCIVDSSTGALDARLETQLARLAETLLAVRTARRSGEGA